MIKLGITKEELYGPQYEDKQSRENEKMEILLRELNRNIVSMNENLVKANKGTEKVRTDIQLNSGIGRTSGMMALGGGIGGAIATSAYMNTFGGNPNMLEAPSENVPRLVRSKLDAIGYSIFGNSMLYKREHINSSNLINARYYNEELANDAVMNAKLSLVSAGLGMGGVAGSAGVSALVGGGLVGGALGGVIAAPLAVAGAAVAQASAYHGEKARIRGDLLETSWKHIYGANSNSEIGEGFSRRERQDITNTFVKKQFDDKWYDLDDYTKALSTAMKNEQFSDVRSVDEFKKRMEKLIENAKVISGVLSKTLDESMNEIKRMSLIGGTSENAHLLSLSLSGARKSLGLSSQEMYDVAAAGAGASDNLIGSKTIGAEMGVIGAYYTGALSGALDKSLEGKDPVYVEKMKRHFEENKGESAKKYTMMGVNKALGDPAFLSALFSKDEDGNFVTNETFNKFINGEMDFNQVRTNGTSLNTMDVDALRNNSGEILDKVLGGTTAEEKERNIKFMKSAIKAGIQEMATGAGYLTKEEIEKEDMTRMIARLVNTYSMSQQDARIQAEAIKSIGTGELDAAVNSQFNKQTELQAAALIERSLNNSLGSKYNEYRRKFKKTTFEMNPFADWVDGQDAAQYETELASRRRDGYVVNANIGWEDFDKESGANKLRQELDKEATNIRDRVLMKQIIRSSIPFSGSGYAERNSVLNVIYEKDRKGLGTGNLFGTEGLDNTITRYKNFNMSDGLKRKVEKLKELYDKKPERKIYTTNNYQKAMDELFDDEGELRNAEIAEKYFTKEEISESDNQELLSLLQMRVKEESRGIESKEDFNKRVLDRENEIKKLEGEVRIGYIEELQPQIKSEMFDNDKRKTFLKKLGLERKGSRDLVTGAISGQVGSVAIDFSSKISQMKGGSKALKEYLFAEEANKEKKYKSLKKILGKDFDEASLQELEAFKEKMKSISKSDEDIKALFDESKIGGMSNLSLVSGMSKLEYMDEVGRRATTYLTTGSSKDRTLKSIYSDDRLKALGIKTETGMDQNKLNHMKRINEELLPALSLDKEKDLDYVKIEEKINLALKDGMNEGALEEYFTDILGADASNIINEGTVDETALKKYLKVTKESNGLSKENIQEVILRGIDDADKNPYARKGGTPLFQELQMGSVIGYLHAIAEGVNKGDHEKLADISALKGKEMYPDANKKNEELDISRN